MNKRFIILIFLLLSIPLAWAVIDWEIPNNKMVFGDGAATIDKIFEANVGDGASNPKLTVNNTTKDFTLSAQLSVKGDIIVGTSAAADQKMIFDIGGSNPFLKWDNAQGALVFSNDGTISKKIGSGGGGAGGQNFFLDNPDAEASTNNWTNTGGGTFVTFSTNPINGDNSFRWDAAAQSDVLRTDQVIIPEKFKGQSCQIEFTYTGGTSDLVKPQVVDSGNIKLDSAVFQNEVDNSDFLQAQTGIVVRSIYFICPLAGTVAFEFNQTEVGDPAEMDLDDVFIGELKGLSTTILKTPEQITFHGDLGHGSTDNKIGRYDLYDIDDAQSFISATGVTDSTGKGAITFTSSVANGTVITINVGGEYKISASKSFTTAINIGLSRNSNQLTTTIASIDNDDRLTNTFNAGTSDTEAINWAGILKKDDVIRMHTSGVGVGPNPSIAVFNIVFTGSDTTVQIFNSIPKIAENINEFSAFIDNNGASGLVLRENVDWISANCTRTGVGAIDCTYISPFTVNALNCVAVAQTTGSEHAFVVSSSNTGFTVETENTTNGTNSDIDFHIVCQKNQADFKTATVQPVIVGQVTNSFASGGHNIRIESCKILNSGTPIIDTGSGLCEGWIDSLTDLAVGRTTLNIKSGIFSSEPVCVATANVASSRLAMVESTITSAVIIRTSTDASALIDANFSVSCIGER